MTTRTVKHRRHAVKRRRPVRRRRSPGFWRGFRHATHTDHLRQRVGGAAGRALIRRINRRRARQGKPPIPQRGGDWYTLPQHVRPVRSSTLTNRPARGTATVRTPKPIATATTGQARGQSQTPRVAGQPVGPTATQRTKATASRVVKGPTAVTTKGQAQAAGAPPVFSGPTVKASSGKASRRKVPLGSISVTSSGVSGPGNRGAGAGIGAPAYGTGGANGDDGHMISPGSAGGSATGGAPMGPGGSSPSRPAPTQTTTQGADGTNGSGGSTMSQPSTGTTGAAGGAIENLSEAPATDAEYIAALRGLSDDVRGWGDRIEEIQASLLEHVGMDQAALGAYTAMAEHAQGLSDASQQAVIDFLNTYQGVIETAQSGVKIPGGEGRFFTGDVA